MNQPDQRLNPHLDAALQRIRTAAEQAAERGAEGLGLAALSAGMAKRRDALLAAQFVFRQNTAKFTQEFVASLRQQMAGEQKPRNTPKKKEAWAELSLMDDEQVDALVAADRIGMAIGHQSEWELREVESFLAGLSSAEGGLQRNPLRPELIAQALLDGIHAITTEQDVRQLLVDELTRAFATEMRTCYGDIAGLFRNRGLRQQDLRVRGVEGHRGGPAHPSASVSGDPGGFAQSQAGALGPAAGVSSFGGMPQYGPAFSGSGMQSLQGGVPAYGPATGMPAGYGPAAGVMPGAAYPGGGYGGGLAYGSGVPVSGVMGAVDPQLMELLRQLSSLPVLPAGAGAPALGSPSINGPLGGSTLSAGWDEEGQEGGPQLLAMPANLIQVHREQLRQAASGSLDHMVIDVVGSLFDHILSDPKVPPQMARQLARLQLPVLRAALGDPSFFSSRRHPVRRFINRLASLACAYDDFSESPGKDFLLRVRELVQDVASGDFDRIELYDQKLDALEAFIAEQTAQGLQAHGDAAALVERKEIDLRLQQRYAQQLQKALADVQLQDFLREFLLSTWSHAIVMAQRSAGQNEVDAAAREQRFRQFGRDLVMSVQPKAPGPQRQAFLSQLPKLMQTLNEGLDLIAWPETARKNFIGQLLPLHAESLKGQGLSPLAYNLLARQLEGVFGCEPPKAEDLPPPEPASDDGQESADLSPQLSAAEAQSLGLVSEAAVDWNGEVDIDLSADAPLQAQDLKIEGLPAPTEEPEPSSGALLIEHLQLGFAYQMLTGEQWQKVRLAHISAGRSFFIFTQGHKHQQTVTMTARMLRKLCETGRLRAFENAYLLERATARARKQLAALIPAS